MLKNLACGLLLVTAVFGAQFLTVDEPIEGSYITVLKKGASVDKHLELVRAKLNVTVGLNYSIGEFQGYHTTADKAGLDSLLALDDVDYIEQDGVVRNYDCQSQSDAPWGLKRTSNLATGQSSYKYPTDASGEGIKVYVIDTGIRITHEEFGGRAIWGANFISGEGDTDGNGHGTHCAGTIAGKTYGMAKKATVVAVKVLSAAGSGSTSGVIGGVDWADNDDKKGGSVLSMSLGGGASKAMDDAIKQAANKQHVVVASGNENTDACKGSPAKNGGKTGKIITVNSQTDSDARSSFSNYGACTDIFAPGSSITSAWSTSDTAINTISGTSMATPHVAGMMAKFLSSEVGEGESPKDAKDWLTEGGGSIEDKISNPGSKSPNKLLNADCDKFVPVY